MRLVSEVTVKIKKGLFPQLIFDLYKCGCELHNLRLIDSTEREEQFILEILYHRRNNFLHFISSIESYPEKYSVVTIGNALEEKIKGGLLRISGKLPLETVNDYEIDLLGATELVHGKIRKGVGFDFTGISRNIGLLGCVKTSNENSSDDMLILYSNAEKDSVIISRLIDLNPVPLLVNYDQPEDLLKAIGQIKGTFSFIRIINSDPVVSLPYEQLYSDTALPLISYIYDEVPLHILTIVRKILEKNAIDKRETTVGIIGINISAIRLAKIFMDFGFYRVLGFDHNEKLMLMFENSEGLATTSENILNNADLIILLKKNFEEDFCRKIRPGQYFISLLDDGENFGDMILKNGAREFINVDLANFSAVFPGLIRGMLRVQIPLIDNERLVRISSKLVNDISDNYFFPDIFSGIHEKVQNYFV